jgi:hypothetical protein
MSPRKTIRGQHIYRSGTRNTMDNCYGKNFEYHGMLYIELNVQYNSSINNHVGS